MDVAIFSISTGLKAIFLQISRTFLLKLDSCQVCLQMCILDGNAYDAKCLEAGQEREEDLDGCSLLLNNKVQLSHHQNFPCLLTCPLRRVLGFLSNLCESASRSLCSVSRGHTAKYIAFVPCVAVPRAAKAAACFAQLSCHAWLGEGFQTKRVALFFLLHVQQTNPLLLHVQQTNPLLVPGGAASHSPQHKVVVALQVRTCMRHKPLQGTQASV